MRVNLVPDNQSVIFSEFMKFCSAEYCFPDWNPHKNRFISPNSAFFKLVGFCFLFFGLSLKF